MKLVDLNNHNIIITGGSSGIGRETALLLNKLGANIILIARNEEKLKEVFNFLEGNNNQYISFDLTNFNDYKSLFKQIKANYNSIEGLVHSAGINKILPLRNIDNDKIDKIMNINYKSFVLLSKYVTNRKIINRNKASIVAISSISSQISNKGYSLYSASKASIEASIRSFAQEYASKNIRFNAVAPGWIKTDLTDETSKLYSKDKKEKMINDYPLGPGYPEDISNTIAFLLSDASRWITGTTITVDGGFTTR